MFTKLVSNCMAAMGSGHTSAYSMYLTFLLLYTSAIFDLRFEFYASSQLSTACISLYYSSQLSKVIFMCGGHVVSARFAGKGFLRSRISCYSNTDPLFS